MATQIEFKTKKNNAGLFIISIPYFMICRKVPITSSQFKKCKTIFAYKTFTSIDPFLSKPKTYSDFLCALWILASCSALPKPSQERQKALIVTATAFTSPARQGQGAPSAGAWEDRIAPGMNAVAVSGDLAALGSTLGVRIEGLRGEYVVLDRMPEKWEKRMFPTKGARPC